MASTITRRPLTDAEAAALQARCPKDWDHLRFLGGPDGFDACDGPIVVDGELELDMNVLVVIGDLTCDILFVDDIASLIVSGNLRARAVIANGNIRVFGDLDCRILTGASFCNGIFGCLGSARIGALFEDGHFFDFHGSVDAGLVAPVLNVVKLPESARIGRDFRAGMDAGQAREAFDASVLDDDGALDYDLVCRALWDGRSPLR